jgi:hypothetical protein
VFAEVFTVTAFWDAIGAGVSREVKLDLNLIGEGTPDAPGIFSPAILPGNGLYLALYRITLGTSSGRPEIQLPSFRCPRKNYLTSS